MGKRERDFYIANRTFVESKKNVNKFQSKQDYKIINTIEVHQWLVHNE